MRTRDVMIAGMPGTDYSGPAQRNGWQVTALTHVDEALARLNGGTSSDLILVALPLGAMPLQFIHPFRAQSGMLAVVSDVAQFTSCARELMDGGVTEVLPGPLSEACFEALLLRVSRLQNSANTIPVENSRKVTFLVGQPLHEVEQEMLVRTLEMTNGNRTRAAAILGISVRTLYSKLLEIEQQRKLAAAKTETPLEPARRSISSGSRQNLASV